MRFVGRPLIFLMGIICLALGLVGTFVPLLPTTPFLILAAYLFNKSSPRMHAWVLSLPKIGPAVDIWERSGVIRPEAKKLATFSIIIVFSLSLFFVPVRIPIKLLISLVGVAVLVFIWSRPSFPTQDS